MIHKKQYKIRSNFFNLWVVTKVNYLTLTNLLNDININIALLKLMHESNYIWSSGELCVKFRHFYLCFETWIRSVGSIELIRNQTLYLIKATRIIGWVFESMWIVQISSIGRTNQN